MALLVGLTGGMGSGKSTVTKLLMEEGAHGVDADALSRMLVEPGKPAWKEIIQLLGNDVLKPDETLDRGKIADIVFKEPEKKKALEAILHPRVMAEEQRLYREIVQKEPDALVVVDAALLIESKNHLKMDKVIVVSCNEKTQIARVVAQGKFSREDVERRLSLQMPIAEKLQYADHVVPNDAGLPELKKIVKTLFQQLKAEAA